MGLWIIQVDGSCEEEVGLVCTIVWVFETTRLVELLNVILDGHLLEVRQSLWHHLFLLGIDWRIDIFL